MAGSQVAEKSVPVRKSRESSLCVGTLEMAVKGLKAGERPIHHSDRGTQYCSREYVGRRRAPGLKVSMTEANHCADNALPEVGVAPVAWAPRRTI